MSPSSVIDAPRSAPIFAPVQTRRAFEEVCDRVRAQIAAGALRPGDKLPPERELAVQLGVGRNALREALRSLEIAGIVRLQKGSKGGAFIQSGDARRMNEVVRDMLSLGSISVVELTESRVHIQDLVVRLACERATRSDFDAIAVNIETTQAMTTESRYLERVECSREFYRLLVAAAHNQVLAMMVRSITEILMQFVYARVAEGGKPQPRLVEKRRAFLIALRARDAEEATRLMRLHLASVHRLLEPFAVPAVRGDSPVLQRRQGDARGQ